MPLTNWTEGSEKPKDPKGIELAVAPLAELRDPGQFQRLGHPFASKRVRRERRSLGRLPSVRKAGYTGLKLTPGIKLSGLVARRG